PDDPAALHSFPTRRSSDLTNAFAMVPDLAVANGRLFVRNGQRQAAAIREDRIGTATCGTVEAFSAEDQFHSRALLTKAAQTKKRSEEHTSELQSRENLVCR